MTCGDNMDEEMVEDPQDRRQGYLQSSMDEVSEPDEWAQLHYRDRDESDHERMVAFFSGQPAKIGEFNYYALQHRRAIAEIAGNWEEAADYSRAINEMEALRDFAHMAIRICSTDGLERSQNACFAI